LSSSIVDVDITMALATSCVRRRVPVVNFWRGPKGRLQDYLGNRKVGANNIDRHGMPELKNMKTWTDRLGHSKLRSFTDDEGRFWLEQNSDKRSKWAKLARMGHEIAWEFAGPGGAYTGRMLIDGEIYTPSEATKKFLKVD
jgi:hypothetical protein